jgi:hypothetical protein
MGLVFGSRRTCIDCDCAEWILKEDGFRLVSEREVPKIGDIVIYRRGDQAVSHLGWLVGIDGIGDMRIVRVLSKWGFVGEYFHPIDHVPSVYGVPSEYWTDRHEETI